jgi:hypothetical protein
VNDELKKWLPWIVAGILALIFVVVLVANIGGGDTVATNSTTTTAPDTTTTTAPDTTTTTAPDTTSTSPVPETTTSTVPTETTSTLPSGTTTTGAELSVELNDEGVQAGAEWVHFGFDDDDAVDAVAAIVGAPTHDSGWVESFSDYGACPLPEVRGVHWDDFIMLFTKADTDFASGGIEHFFAYYFTGSTPDLLTTEGIAIGSSVEDLEAAYGGPRYTMDESFFDPSGGFWTYDLQTWTGLWGYSTGQTPTHAVTSINGGQGCGE